jgi:transposase-like protein
LVKTKLWAAPASVTAVAGAACTGLFFYAWNRNKTEAKKIKRIEKTQPAFVAEQITLGEIADLNRDVYRLHLNKKTAQMTACISSLGKKALYHAPFAAYAAAYETFTLEHSDVNSCAVCSKESSQGAKPRAKPCPKFQKTFTDLNRATAERRKIVDNELNQAKLVLALNPQGVQQCAEFQKASRKIALFSGYVTLASLGFIGLNK